MVLHIAQSALMFTQVRSADRRVAPVEGQNHKSVMKAVYVVLEPQYQNALTQAATALNASCGDLGIELSGYLIEELRDDDNYAHVAAWEWNGPGEVQTRHTEQLDFVEVTPSTRSYK